MAFRRATLPGIALGLLVTASAFAQVGSPVSYTGPNGLYLRGEGGASLPNGEKGEGLGGQGQTLNYNSTENAGFIAGGAVGYKIDQLRLELGLDFSSSDVNSITVNNDGGLGSRLHVASLNGASINPSGSLHATTGMLNGFWDFRTGTPFVPYVGMGVGIADVSAANFKVGGQVLSNSSDLVFAYQPMAGVRYLLSDNLWLGLEYRYIATTQPTFKDSTGVAYHGRFESHNVLASLSWSFGVPPAPAPAPAPAVMPAAAPAPIVAPAPALAPAPVAAPKAYVVFFDFNKASLTSEAKQVVEAAAAAYKRGDRHVQLTGYTDSAGNDRLNLELSRRRAETVRDYLVARGVPADQIDTSWRGKENPRVPTGDGVREPQNRRVEILMP